MSTDSVKKPDSGVRSEVKRADIAIGLRRQIILSPTLALIIAIFLFVAYGITQSEAFTNPQTWVNILRDASFPMMVAVFMTIVLVAGGLDLSVGSILVAGAMTSATLATNDYGLFITIVGGTLVGTLVGVINGIIINYFDIPAIIVTLGSLFAVRSLVTHLSGGNTIGNLPENFKAIGQGSFFGIPNVVYIAVLVALLAYFILHLSPLGWALRAIGGNRVAARSAGINVKLLSTFTYIMSGSAAAFAGVLLTARLGAGAPSIAGGFELTVIAAAIIGGTSIYGAIGTIPGSVLGALLLSILATGLVLLRVDPTLTNLVTGLVLIGAAGLDVLRRKQMFRISAKSSQTT